MDHIHTDDGHLVVKYADEHRQDHSSVVMIVVTVLRQPHKVVVVHHELLYEVVHVHYIHVMVMLEHVADMISHQIPQLIYQR